MHACECTCVLHLFSVCFLCSCLQISYNGFQSSAAGVVQVNEHSIGDPVYFFWLGYVSVPRLCWGSVAAVWMCSLQHWQTTCLDPNEIQIENFTVCLVCDIDTPLGSTRL